MHYLPRSSIRNAFAAITVLSNVPSILVLVLVPYLLSDLADQLLFIGTVFMIYRLGNITRAFCGPKVASLRKPHILAAWYETGNALFSIMFLLSLELDDGSLPLYASLYFCKGVIGGLHNNTRFQWLKALSKETITASKIQVYTGAITQASFGVGGILLLLSSTKDTSFFKLIFLIDVLTSAIAVFLFIRIKSKPLPQTPSTQSFSFIGNLKSPVLTNLAIADFFIALAVAGTNMLILKFGNQAFSTENGYSAALVVYSIAFVIGSYVINEVGINKFTLLWQVFTFALASGGMWLLPSPFNIASYFAFFILYPLISLGLEKAWFESLEQKLAGHIYARRLMALSVVWAVGEAFYATLKNELTVRFMFIVLGLNILTFLRCFKEKNLNVRLAFSLQDLNHIHFHWQPKLHDIRFCLATNILNISIDFVERA